MIPSFEAVEASYAFLSRRFGFQGALHEEGVREALDLANSLATTEADESAAVFFALMRYPKALGGAVRALPAMLAFNTARAGGRNLNATSAELRGFLVPIASGSMSYDHARTWFAARLEPLVP